MKIIKTNCHKGTRILLGVDKRVLINHMVDRVLKEGYQEISMPAIYSQSTFNSKVGEENKMQMFNFTDKAMRHICLAPEYTAVIQAIRQDLPQDNDLKLFYVQECFRGEKPQAGRYRQFTQLGVEILNPTRDHTNELIDLGMRLTHQFTGYGTTLVDFDINKHVKRGLSYYKKGTGFEICCHKLGAQNQLLGGGQYEGGIGFAIGVDRVLLLTHDGEQLLKEESAP